MKRLVFLLYLLTLLLACSCFSCRNEKKADTVIVHKVVDGDTFHALDESGRVLKIRLIGLDAPETRKSEFKDIGYYGKESTAYLKSLIDGKSVRLEFDIGKNDRYGRLLAYVYLEDGTFVNAELIKQGYARVLTVPPNVKYADEFIRLQRKARRANRGMWQPENQ